IGLQDDSMPRAVEAELSIVVTDIDKSEAHRKSNDKKASEKNGAGNGQMKGAATHGLPSYKLLTKDGRKIGDQDTEKWPADFDEHEGGLIQDLGNDEI